MDYQPPRGAIWAAGAFTNVIDMIGCILDSAKRLSRDASPLGPHSTPSDVRRYAQSISHREPSFAADLMAAANRAEE